MITTIIQVKRSYNIMYMSFFPYHIPQLYTSLLLHLDPPLALLQIAITEK